MSFKSEGAATGDRPEKKPELNWIKKMSQYFIQ